MLVSIPPKYSVAEVIGFIKGKSSIWIAQNIERKAKNFTGHKFWARGYFVSTLDAIALAERIQTFGNLVRRKCTRIFWSIF